MEKSFRKVALGWFLAFKALGNEGDQQGIQAALPIGIARTGDSHYNLGDRTRKVLDGPVHHKVLEERGLCKDPFLEEIGPQVVEKPRL